jgi:hypothetical protein
MRIYLPTTLRELATAVAAGGYGSASQLAFGVSPALREWYTNGDQEELEYVAMTDAARESLHRLHADPLAPSRRVVVAADVPDEQASWEPERHRAAVRISGPVPLAAFASVHADEPDAEAAVRAALGSLAAADSGDPNASFVVDAVEDHELLWYSVQEIPDLLRGVIAS